VRDVQLRDFLAVVDTGGIRAAARKSGQSQASISRNLAALERYYGAPLLERSAAGIRLTESGQLLLPHARLVSVELEKAREEISGVALGRSRMVNVAVSASGEAVLLARVVERFHARHPDATLHIAQGSPSQVAAGLREGTLDLAAFPSSGVLGQGFTCQRLFSADLIIAARPHHPQVGVTRLAQLACAKWIKGASSEGEESVLRVLRLAGLPHPNYIVQRESFSALLNLLLRTDLLATVTRPSVAPFLEAGSLVELPLYERLPAIVFNLYAREGRSLGKLAESVASELRRAARAQRR